MTPSGVDEWLEKAERNNLGDPAGPTKCDLRLLLQVSWKLCSLCSAVKAAVPGTSEGVPG